MKNIIFLLFALNIYFHSFAKETVFFLSDSIQNSIVKDSLTKHSIDSLALSVSKDTISKKPSLPASIDSGKIQTQILQNDRLDKIVKKNGDSVLCKIINKNLYEIEYLKPGKKITIKLSTANIKEIYYASGKYELIDNTPEKKKKDWTVVPSENEWRNITVTYESKDISGLIEKGPLDAFFEAKKINSDNDLLERTACNILKKKASSMKATVILIVAKKFYRMYGEMPSIELKAIAYGKE